MDIGQGNPAAVEEDKKEDEIFIRLHAIKAVKSEEDTPDPKLQVMEKK